MQVYALASFPYNDTPDRGVQYRSRNLLWFLTKKYRVVHFILVAIRHGDIEPLLWEGNSDG